METIYEVYGLRTNLLFEEESVLDYKPRGYHPVALEDSFQNGRYQIRHKLGWGGFSTVWLAWDSKWNKWVTLKIMVAEQGLCARELQGFQRLAGCRRIVRLLDRFMHEGPNGLHQCLVFELLGPTLDRVMEEFHGDEDGLDTTGILKMAKEILETVTSIHAAGFAHGDLSTKNIAFRDSRLSTLTQEDLFKVLLEPETEDITRVDGKALDCGVPSQYVKSTQWWGWPDAYNWSDDESDDSDDSDVFHPEICLIDLGEVFAKDDVPERLAQPGGQQAPETILGQSFDYKVDLWRAGLVMFCLAFGHLPFGWYGRDVLAAGMIELAGDLPTEWRSSWIHLKQEATWNSVKSLDHESACSTQSTLEQKYASHKDGAKLQPLLTAMARLLRLSPSDRISAKRALKILNKGTERSASVTRDRDFACRLLKAGEAYGSSSLPDQSVKRDRSEECVSKGVAGEDGPSKRRAVG